MLKYHYDHGNLDIGTFLLSILIGPAIAPILRSDEKKLEKLQERKYEGNKHRRWFQIRDIIDRERFRRIRGYTIPPPPISKKKKNIDDFKFFRGYDKN
jgi:hypothetical protein